MNKRNYAIISIGGITGGTTGGVGSSGQQLHGGAGSQQLHDGGSGGQQGQGSGGQGQGSGGQGQGSGGEGGGQIVLYHDGGLHGGKLFLQWYFII